MTAPPALAGTALVLALPIVGGRPPSLPPPARAADGGGEGGEGIPGCSATGPSWMLLCCRLWAGLCKAEAWGFVFARRGYAAVAVPGGAGRRECALGLRGPRWPAHGDEWSGGPWALGEVARSLSCGGGAERRLAVDPSSVWAVRQWEIAGCASTTYLCRVSVALSFWARPFF